LNEAQSRKLDELHEQMVPKAQSIAFSKMSDANFQEIQNTSGIQLKMVYEPPAAFTPTTIAAFVWDDSPEPAQSDRQGSILDWRWYDTLCAILALGFQCTLLECSNLGNQNLRGVETESQPRCRSILNLW